MDDVAAVTKLFAAFDREWCERRQNAVSDRFRHRRPPYLKELKERTEACACSKERGGLWNFTAAGL